MPLKKILFKPGVNRENTRYTTEGGWFTSNLVRFRQGTPEKIGGWVRISERTFLGICRSLWNWVTLGALNLVGVGTNLKFYIERGGLYNDITPLRLESQPVVFLTNPFDTVASTPTVTVNATAHGLVTGDIAMFSGSTEVGGIPAQYINTNHFVTVVDPNIYTITLPFDATTTVSGGGGTVSAIYKKADIPLTNPFTATLGSSVITVSDPLHGCVTGDFVTFITPSGLGGNITAAVLTGEFQVTVIDANSYAITVSAIANATDVAGSPGGGAVIAQYQINVGPEIQIPLTGWGAGAWGAGSWGNGGSSLIDLRIWSQMNFGEDLVFAPRDGPLYLWDASQGIGNRGYLVSDLWGASDVPTSQRLVFVSDISRYVFAFGCNDYGSNEQDPMLIRWSNRESVVDWTPSATSEAGSIRLSHGSKIVSVAQTRQEIVVFTDSSIYSLQFKGSPDFWGVQLLGDNISIYSQNASAVASGKVYWMGVDKFYVYDGRVQTLRCDLRNHIFSNINTNQSLQVFSGTNEGFNEVWWFYCSSGSSTVDKYVIYNYVEDVWYYGNLARTAWLDSGLREFPLAATYINNLVNHESGVDDNATGVPQPINAVIGSSEFDIDDGHNFGFIWRMLPDITFRDSTGNLTPQVTMTLSPMQNSGAGVNNPASRGGSDSAAVQRVAVATVEEFTGQVYIRVRGRQLIFTCESNQLGTQWQLGAPRIDIKSDGRRGNS